MNLELLESFGQNYPEEPDGSLDCISMAVTCCFNRFGTLFAVGCNDGRIVVWDFLTRGIAKIIAAHVHPICSLSWSRSGDKLASASTDNNVSVWDIKTGECDQRLKFPSPVLRVQFNPRLSDELLVVPMRHAAVLVNLTDGGHKLVPVDDDSDLQIFASYDKRGENIYTGNSKGKILIVDREKLKVVKQFKLTQTLSNAVKGIEFSRRGESFLVNTADRVIRVYNTKDVMESDEDKDPEPVQKLQDLVNRTMWKKCCFSGDGEYVCAGSAKQHALYIWEKTEGHLVKILASTRGQETLLDVVWHPVRPIVASISSGLVSLWAQQQVENWSAFAPDFKELDENVDYEERESEFDKEDEDRSVKSENEELDVEVDVDVTTKVSVPAYCSSDEETEDNNALLFLPIAPEVEDPEDGYNNDPDESPNKRVADDKENASPKKKRTKTIDIQLENAPSDEVHPMLHKNSSNKDRNASKKVQGRPSKGDKGKNKGK